VNNSLKSSLNGSVVSRRSSRVAILIVVLLLVFLFVPIVPIQRRLDITHNATRTIAITFWDHASIGYYLFGVGTAPFVGFHTYRTTSNGTAVEVVLYNGDIVNASIGTLPLSIAPMADVRLQVLVETTQLFGSTLASTFENSGNSNITELSIWTSFDGLQGQAVSITPNQTATVTFVIYASPQIVIGTTYLVSIYGQIVNDSTFRYYTSVKASKS
jgi:hypothetical protein